VESLDVKLGALEAGDTANVMLSLIDQMKNESPPLPMRYLYFKAFAFHVHGNIALDEGTEESARRAVAKSKYEGDSNIEEFVKTFQELYALRVTKNGEGNENTIHAGKDYAVEAMELLTKLLATSKQVLGPHHNITKQVESTLEFVNNESIGNDDADQD
jgi:hypothetical protein